MPVVAQLTATSCALAVQATSLVPFGTGPNIEESSLIGTDGCDTLTQTQSVRTLSRNLINGPTPAMGMSCMLTQPPVWRLGPVGFVGPFLCSFTSRSFSTARELERTVPPQLLWAERSDSFDRAGEVISSFSNRSFSGGVGGLVFISQRA